MANILHSSDWCFIKNKDKENEKEERKRLTRNDSSSKVIFNNTGLRFNLIVSLTRSLSLCMPWRWTCTAWMLTLTDLSLPKIIFLLNLTLNDHLSMIATTIALILIFQVHHHPQHWHRHRFYSGIHIKMSKLTNILSNIFALNCSNAIECERIYTN